MSTENAREPTVERLSHEIRKLRVSEAERNVCENGCRAIRQKGKSRGGGGGGWVGGVRGSGAADTHVAKGVYFVLDSLRDWEPREENIRCSDLSVGQSKGLF